MTQKLVLAEALDLLRQCEINEYDLDKTRERVRGNNKYKGELFRLVQGYYSVYTQFLRGIEILNYVRHQALDNHHPQAAQYNKNLSDFCSGKMSAYMDRCDNIIRKLDDILLPLDQIVLVTKEGYVPEDTLYMQDGNSYPLTRKESAIAKEFTLMDGTYILTVKNLDDYSIAAPAVGVVLSVTPQRGSGAEPMRVSQSIPTQSGWRKIIGVVAAASLQLEVRSTGIRDSHVDVLLQRWRPASGGGPGASPFAGDVKNLFSSDFASVAKSGQGTGSSAAFEYGEVSKPGQMQAQHQQQYSGNYGPDSYSGSAVSSASPQPQHQQGYASGLPALPDDDLAALANYNVPQASLPPRGSACGAPPVPQHQQQLRPEDAWAALEHLNVPHVSGVSTAHTVRVPEPVEVNPAGLTCKERLAKAREMLNAWPHGNVPMANLPTDKQRIVQSVYALPFPRDLS